MKCKAFLYYHKRLYTSIWCKHVKGQEVQHNKADICKRSKAAQCLYKTAKAKQLTTQSVQEVGLVYHGASLF